MLNIYITNLGKYNEGELMGEWVALPCNDLESVYERIGINEEYEEMFITDYESDFEGLQIGEYDNIEDLNEWAEELEAVDADVVAAILEAEGGSLEDAISRADDVIFYPGMTLLDVAYELVDECYDLPEIAQRYFDYEAFARDLSFDGYTETSTGTICTY